MRKAVASLSTTRIVFLGNFHLPHKDIIAATPETREFRRKARPDLNTPSSFFPHEKPPFFLRRKFAGVHITYELFAEFVINDRRGFRGCRTDNGETDYLTREPS